MTLAEDRRQRTEDRCAVAAVPRHLYKRAALRHTKPLSSVFCLLSSVCAAEVARPAYTPPPPAVSSGNIAQIIFSLLLVLAAIVLVAWLLKRMNVAQQGSVKLLKVLGAVPIGQRERIVLVEIKDTWLVVGVGPGQIRTLHSLQKMEDSAIDLQHTEAQSSGTKFSSLLSSVLNHRKQKTIDK
ncbi:MAG: flagellar biosynthetic protein FliO [Nitrosomonadales bacterium]|nr:flagellar biosynthetic protein FliO [Nitrosomonadales bacterium]